MPSVRAVAVAQPIRAHVEHLQPHLAQLLGQHRDRVVVQTQRGQMLEEQNLRVETRPLNAVHVQRVQRLGQTAQRIIATGAHQQLGDGMRGGGNGCGGERRQARGAVGPFALEAEPQRLQKAAQLNGIAADLQIVGGLTEGDGGLALGEEFGEDALEIVAHLVASAGFVGGREEDEEQFGVGGVRWMGAERERGLLGASAGGAADDTGGAGVGAAVLDGGLAEQFHGEMGTLDDTDTDDGINKLKHMPK